MLDLLILMLTDPGFATGWLGEAAADLTGGAL